MRQLSELLVVILPIFLLAGTATAGAPVEVLISSASDESKTAGQALGRTETYVLTVTSPNMITFAIEADSDVCGVDFAKASQRGILRSLRAFPATYSDRGQAGDIYTLSFYQTRVAALSDKACNFAFNVQQM